ncbi:esterase-like activity of phytase family protein [Corynebacterium evansiae]|uniref:Esterase-like activity of phytase family protein n=1 Tax=Corynebacterium evansiae TaxID=2913499 RepID=A0A9X3LL07_9CORY|nr:esterase-like activity of phytase family protein [Corynebacterium evansiae]MCZ9289304.1 esterase-like activity of phytase family protein [Corynebacterium evansiae]
MQLNNLKNSVSQRAQRKVAGISLALAVIPFAAVPAANATVGSQTVVGSTLGSSSFGSSAGSSAGSTAGSSLPGSSAPGSSGPAGSLQPGKPGKPGTPDAQSTFERTATYPVYENRPEGEDKSAETVAEISTVSKDGKTLIHTDALAQRIGFIDISNPNAPKGLGTLDLKAQGHAKDEPTSVAVYGDYLLVVIDETGGDFANPKGRVDIVRVSDRTRVSSIDLQGQPDSIAISPAGAPGSPKAAIAMENQRDEELNDGNLPQLPTGFVQTIDLSGDAKDWKATPIRFEDENGKLLDEVKKAGLDTPEDLEPEYVSINGRNQLAVTLQENNGVALIDLQTNRITNVFSAGSAEVKGVDTKSDKIINPTDTLPATPREPDAIAWIDDNHVATANEGDWKGGTRGWTVFDASGKIVWDAGNSVENLAIRHGLHNNKRAKKKGVEIEGIATAKMNGTNYAFVGSERSNFVAVYNVNDPANPQFVQMLFTTNGPEGILPIPERNMLAVSSEVDEPDNAVRSAVTLYRLGGEESQPSIVSADQGDAPIGWGALGALTADPKDANRLYAASDSAYANGWVYTIDASKQPAVITERRAVKRDGAPAEDLDIEGISVAADGGFWIASEGKKGKDNRLFHTDKDLNITSAVELPADVAEHIGKWGLEGVSSTKDENGVEQLFVAVQRPLWKDPEAKDREALEGDNTTRIGKYDTKTKQWQWFGYELEKSAGKGDWMGLSEITALDDKHLLVIERDKLNGPDAKVKRVMKVTLPEGRAEGAAASANGLALPMVNKELAVDVLPKLRATNGWTQEKLEGFTIAADGQMYAVTDNDALEDATGETVFLRLGKVK